MILLDIQYVKQLQLLWFYCGCGDGKAIKQKLNNNAIGR